MIPDSAGPAFVFSRNATDTPVPREMNILATSHRSVAATEPSWQAILKAAYRRPDELARVLRLPDEFARSALAASQSFTLFAPQPFIDLIEPGRSDDPLLLQIWPSPNELLAHPDERRDPVGDRRAHIAPGVLHKYHGRALLILTGACGIHCRYCFRKNWSYSDSPQSLPRWEDSLRAIDSDESIQEVILSGGDPLLWDDTRLEQLLSQIAQIKHVRRLRLHTRMPIVIPQRITPNLLNLLRQPRLQTVVVVHVNHRRELSDLVAAALSSLARDGITLLNQSVLLARINDSVEELAGLSERLLECGVLPYYLHQLDPVTGSKHFEVPIERGRALVEELRRRLPGYLVPRYVREIEGEPSKTILA